ncbi:hypothetical protein [Leifsonia sp. fls2-241-R2A-40a]|uniref:hypothetical protein n=1 Tax=Leifsonia sp. fls2-241-R2A-40a TaxID=3040290 RepID=UPI0025518729|nr:hypothetical protein [Leifsonia sp. fls2-241-R2A-40a]
MRGSADGRVPAPRALGDVVGRLSLAALLDEAVDRAEQAEALLTCHEDGEPLGSGEARRCLRLRVAFAELQRWVDELDLGGAEADIRDETSRLLAFYLHLLTHAFERDIGPAGRDRLAIRSRGPMTGAPATRLATLRERIRAAA